MSRFKYQMGMASLRIRGRVAVGYVFSFAPSALTFIGSRPTRQRVEEEWGMFGSLEADLRLQA